MTEFVLMTASANMPKSCWGIYRRVAVLEIDPSKLRDGDTLPRMISERARGVVRVVKTWEACNVGKTSRCAYRQALADASELIADLESGARP